MDLQTFIYLVSQIDLKKALQKGKWFCWRNGRQVETISGIAAIKAGRARSMWFWVTKGSYKNPPIGLMLIIGNHETERHRHMEPEWFYLVHGATLVNGQTILDPVEHPIYLVDSMALHTQQNLTKFSIVAFTFPTHYKSWKKIKYYFEK